MCDTRTLRFLLSLRVMPDQTRLVCVDDLDGLGRSVVAQSGDCDRALAEVAGGRKQSHRMRSHWMRSHWMRYVFSLTWVGGGRGRPGHAMSERVGRAERRSREDRQVHD